MHTELKDFHAGTEYHLQQKLGCHKKNDIYTFQVWAPKAKEVWLVGDFNNWDKSLPMKKDEGGVWKISTSLPKSGQLYKYLVKQASGTEIMKIDPVATKFEKRPGNAAVVGLSLIHI